MDESVLACLSGLLACFTRNSRARHAQRFWEAEAMAQLPSWPAQALRGPYLRRGPERPALLGLLTPGMPQAAAAPAAYWASAETGPDGAEMLFIVVEPAAQGKGVARRLIEAALLELRRRGASRVSVAVATAHPLIGRLLRSLGFAPVTGLDFAEKQHEVLAMELAPPLEARTLPQKETA